MNRREILKRSSALGFVPIGVSSTVSAETNREIAQLTGDEKRNVVNQVRSDTGFSKVASRLWTQGFQIDEEETVTAKVTNADELNVSEYRFAVIEFTDRSSHSRRHSAAQNEGSEKHILWFDREVAGTKIVGYNFVQHSIDNEAFASGTGSGSPSAWTTELVYLENGELKRDTNIEASNAPKQTEESVIAQGHGGVTCGDLPDDSNCYCKVDIIECDEWDWSCLVSSVAGLVGSVKECGPCVFDPSKICVAFCLLAGGGLAASAVDCSSQDSFYLRDECRIEKAWIPPEQFSREPSVDYPLDCQEVKSYKP